MKAPAKIVAFTEQGAKFWLYQLMKKWTARAQTHSQKLHSSKTMGIKNMSIKTQGHFRLDEEGSTWPRHRGFLESMLLFRCALFFVTT